MATLLISLLAFWLTPAVAAPASDSSSAALVALRATEINLLEAPDPLAPAAGFRVVLYSGSADDPPDREGLAWLTAASIRRQAGAGVEITVGKDVTVFTANAPPDGAAALWSALAQAVVKPAFDAQEMERLKHEQKQAIESLRADAGSLVREAFDSFVYRSHPYGHPAVGRESSVDRITREEILAFHAEHYRKGNMAVGLQGAVNGDLAARVRGELSGLPDGAPASSDSAVAWLARPRVLIVEMEGAITPRILMGHHLNVTRAHPDDLSLATALCRLRRPRDLTEPRRQEALAIPADAGPAGASAAIQRVFAVLSALAPAKIQNGEMEEMKRSMQEEQSAATRETSGALASRLADFLYRTPWSADRFSASLGDVSVESVRSAIARHLSVDRVAVVAVTVDAADLMRRILAAAPEDQAAEVPRRAFVKEDFEVVKVRDLFK